MSENQWELKVCKETDYTPDNSGVYVIVNRVVKKGVHKEYAGEWLKIRVDVMLDGDDNALMSFIGPANAVRKRVIRWVCFESDSAKTTAHRLSREHASYIGYEVARAAADEHYVQG